MLLSFIGDTILLPESKELSSISVK